MAALALALLLLGCRSAVAEAEQWEVLPQREITAVDGLMFSEFMSSNKACLAMADGSFPDWLELYNGGTESIELEGHQIRSDHKTWSLPAGSLEPGAYCVVYCDKLDLTDEIGLHSNFALSRYGEFLALYDQAGVMLDALELPALEADTCYVRSGNSWAVSRWPSPGQENSEEGYRCFQRTRTAGDGLAIGEVMVYNEWYCPFEEAYYDWVELTNLGSDAVKLSNYCLSDKRSNRLLFPLPNVTLEPGETRVILCDPDCPDPEAAPFGLSSDTETLYLSKQDGTLCDYVTLRDIPIGCSFGRMPEEGGFYFFASPSPGRLNADGVRFTGTTPWSAEPDGVLEGVKSLRVPLSGPGIIRYTLDGSVPTETSELYQKPIRLAQTTVIRAVSFLDDHLPSEPLDLSFILNEGHTLPVVSLVCDPESLFDGLQGIYSNPTLDEEKPGSVAYFGEDGAFRMACGVKLHGATSRLEMRKKSFKLCFRDRYDGRLHYDLFDNGVLEFDSVLLRADQEGAQSSYMRDNLMHQLSRSAFPALPTQDSRYAVLYLNGAYWGLYTIREAHSDTHFAQHYGYDESTVTQWKGSWDHSSVINEVYKFAAQRDLSKDENYAYVASHVDVDSVIAWCIVQTYSGNFDFNSPNMRFYYTSEDELMRYALVDLDLSFFSYGSFGQILAYGYDYNLMAMYLLKNESFSRRFLQTMVDALDGPLADEAVLARIDALAAEIDPEMPRDTQRWSGSYDSWKKSVEEIRSFITMNAGRAENMVQLLRESGMFERSLIDEYFPQE